MASRGRPLIIQFAADVKNFLRGTKDVERATEDIADELQDAAKDSDKFERKFSAAMDDASAAAQKTSRKVGDDFDKMADGMGEVGQEGANEFKQNLAQGLSAGGGVEDLVQDTLGGIIGGLSGVAAGAATVIAGVSALVFREMEEQAQKAADLATSTVASLDGLYDVLDQRWTQAKATQQVATFLEENKGTLAEIKPLAELIGLDFDKWAVQVSGATGEEQLALDVLNDIIEAEDEIARQQRLGQGQSTARGQQARQIRDLIKETVEEVSDQNREQSVANRLMDSWLIKTGQANEDMRQQVDYWTDIKDRIENLPERVTTWIDFQTTGGGAAYVTRGHANYSPAYVAIDNMNRKEAGR